MRSLPYLLAATLLGACGASEDLPTAAELHGRWSSNVEGTSRDWRFAASDSGAHPELAGLTDVYVLYNYPTGQVPIEVQTGEYRVEVAELTTGMADEALVTVVHSGSGVGGTYGNAILGWTGDTFTLESASSPGGQLVFTRSVTD